MWDKVQSGLRTYKFFEKFILFNHDYLKKYLFIFFFFFPPLLNPFPYLFFIDNIKHLQIPSNNDFFGCQRTY